MGCLEAFQLGMVFERLTLHPYYSSLLPTSSKCAARPSLAFREFQMSCSGDRYSHKRTAKLGKTTIDLKTLTMPPFTWPAVLEVPACNWLLQLGATVRRNSRPANSDLSPNWHLCSCFVISTMTRGCRRKRSGCFRVKRTCPGKSAKCRCAKDLMGEGSTFPISLSISLGNFEKYRRAQSSKFDIMTCNSLGSV